jgi:hypothetical protein
MRPRMVAIQSAETEGLTVKVVGAQQGYSPVPLALPLKPK